MRCFILTTFVTRLRKQHIFYGKNTIKVVKMIRIFSVMFLAAAVLVSCGRGRERSGHWYDTGSEKRHVVPAA